jgi:hypothetical protein
MEDFEIFRPKCDSSKEVLHAIATFQADISRPSLKVANLGIGLLPPALITCPGFHLKKSSRPFLPGRTPPL